MATILPSREHAKCFTKPAQRLRQSRLVFTPQSLSFERPLVFQPPRSPIPQSLRRSTHTPFFSTADRSLTSFLRLPYDIRLQIYRYLLCYSGIIQYELCVTTRRLISIHQLYHDERPYKRHGLFPALLECCRLLNEEASPILYGHNEFKVARCGSDMDQWLTIRNSWPMAESNKKRITRLNMDWRYFTASKNYDALRHYFCDGFQTLRVTKLTLTATPSEWESFLSEYADCLQRVVTIEFLVYIPDRCLKALWNKHQRATDGKEGAIKLEELCCQLYQRVSARFTKQPGKKATWNAYDLGSEHIAIVAISLLLDDSRTECLPLNLSSIKP